MGLSSNKNVVCYCVWRKLFYKRKKEMKEIKKGNNCQIYLWCLLRNCPRTKPKLLSFKKRSLPMSHQFFFGDSTLMDNHAYFWNVLWWCNCRDVAFVKPTLARWINQLRQATYVGILIFIYFSEWSGIDRPHADRFSYQAVIIFLLFAFIFNWL